MVEFRELAFKSIFIAAIVISLDLIIHLLFTAPLETPEYFGIKFVFAVILTFFAYEFVKDNIFTILVAAFVFATIWQGIYFVNADSVFFPTNFPMEAFGVMGEFLASTILYITHIIDYAVAFLIVRKLTGD